MKIEKGYTLSQFIDVVDEYVSYDNHKALGFEFVKRYKSQRWKPITKDMFVNPLTPPMKGDYGLDAPEFNTYKYPQECYEEDLRKYEEAEKKVIFKDFFWAQGENLKWVAILDEKCVVEFNEDYCVVMWHKESGEFEVTTLGDLFDATNGELELKNFEI